MEHDEVSNDFGRSTVEPDRAIGIAEFWQSVGKEPLEVIQQLLPDDGFFKVVHLVWTSALS